MGFKKFEFTKEWTDVEAFPAIETNEDKVREDLQVLHSETKQALHDLIDELEATPAAASLGATGRNGEKSTVQEELDLVNKALRDHIEVDPTSVRDNNVSVTGERVETYGLAELANPTVAHVLDRLAKLLGVKKYMEHWWIRRTSATTYIPEEGDAVYEGNADDAFEAGIAVIHQNWGPSVSADIRYADNAGVDIDGNVYLVEPATVAVAGNSFAEEADVLKGKFVENAQGVVLFIPEDATLNERYHSSYRWTCWASPACPVTAPIPEREWERLHSEQRDAYPDSGEQEDEDGMNEYRYLGVPVERLVDKMVEEVGA